MKFLILSILVSACCAIDFDCLKGPEYFCSSYSRAQKCGRIKECFLQNGNQWNSNVMNMISSNMAGGKTCELCEELVGLIKDKLPKISEQEFVIILNDNICERLKDEQEKICKSFVSLYGPYLYNMFNKIMNETTPENFCTLIKVCETNNVLLLSKLFDQHKLNSPELCEKCKEIFQVLESLFSKVTPDEFKFVLENLVCNQLPSEFKDTCKMLVDGYVSQLYQLIKTFLDGDRMCPLLHFCPSNTTVKKVITDSWNCQTCLDVVAVLKKDLINVPTSDVEAFVKASACSKLSFLVKGICNDYVDSLTPPFINDIHSSLTPQQICSKNKVCRSPAMNKKFETKLLKEGTIKCDLCELSFGTLKKFMSSSKNAQRMKQFAKFKICKHLKSWNTKCSNIVDKYGDLAIQMIINHMNSLTICNEIHACNVANNLPFVSSLKVGSIECEACRLVAGQVKKYISNPGTETLIKNFLKNDVCLIFGPDKIQCQQFIDEYYNIILNFILAQFDIDKVCGALGMCSTSVQLASVECDVCETMMDEVIKVATSDRAELVVSSFLTSDVCDHLGFIKSECDDAIKTYVPMLFSIARSTLNSKVLCTELHLCTLISVEKIKLIMKTTPKSSLKCEICLFGVNETRNLLTNPNIQTAIEDFIKKIVCVHFSNPQTCINDINEYYSLVVNVIVEFLNPHLCTELHLCNSTVTGTRRKQPLIDLVKAHTTTSECELCVKFYNYLQSINTQPREINKVLGIVSLCNGVDSQLKMMCLKQFRNFDQVIKSYNTSKNLSDFCKMSKMCIGTTIKKQSPKVMLGEKSCTWGPGFWCISRHHAIACGPGAVRHCELNVWNKQPIL